MSEFNLIFFFFLFHRLKRANQSYTFSILLSESIIPSPIFYGTLVPIAAYLCAKSFVIDPYNEAEKEKELRKSRNENSAEMIVKRKEAETAIDLMSETYHRNCSNERSKSGLLIERAIYGSKKSITLILENDHSMDSTSTSSFSLSQLTDIHDVRIPLQCLVQNSSLTLPSSSKVN